MNIFELIRPRRRINGMSAILLPFDAGGNVDWAGFDAHVERTLHHGLTPAVNMDTGYANLIDEATRTEVLRRTGSIAGGRDFVGGAYVGDRDGDRYDADAYRSAIEAIQRAGGSPILFQSFGLTSLGDDELLQAYEALGADTDGFYGFELGQMFAPFGRIYDADLYRRWIQIPSMRGAKHSSLRRQDE